MRTYWPAAWQRNRRCALAEKLPLRLCLALPLWLLRPGLYAVRAQLSPVCRACFCVT